MDRRETDHRSRWGNRWGKADGIKWKYLLCAAALGVSVCGQIAFPVTASAATKEAIEAFLAKEESKGAENADGTSNADSSEEVQEDEAILTEEELRQEIVDFALQFEGNPYVYGGTSLTNGADCSGFVMSVFAQFGYALPRVAADQYYQCEKKDISDLEPGDLVFYGGGISHVALYIGDGQIIHASTAATGIKISNYDYETPVGVGTYIESDTEAGFYSE